MALPRLVQQTQEEVPSQEEVGAQVLLLGPLRQPRLLLWRLGKTNCHSWREMWLQNKGGVLLLVSKRPERILWANSNCLNWNETFRLSKELLLHPARLLLEPTRLQTKRPLQGRPSYLNLKETLQQSRGGEQLEQLLQRQVPSQLDNKNLPSWKGTCRQSKEQSVFVRLELPLEPTKQQTQ